MNYHLLHFKEIDSTNDYLKNSHQLLDNLTFVSADYQSHGKGRNDRTWTSNPGDNLMFSFLIKNQELLKQAKIISLVVAMEVASLIETYDIKNVTVKWPNDVLIGDKKVCGILAEAQIPDYLVVGVGVNINQEKFPKDLRRPATSLSLELNKEVSVEEFKEKLIKRIVDSLTNLDTTPYYEYYKKHNYLLCKQVRVLFDGKDLIGQVLGIDKFFNLKVYSNGGLILVDSGEIEILDNTPNRAIDPALIPGVIAVLVFIAAVILLSINILIPSLICFGIAALISAPWLIWFNKSYHQAKKVELDGHKIKAVIFDMDGTLIDSTGLWHEIDKEFFAKRKMDLPEDYAKNIVHLGLKEAAKFTKETYGIKESEQEIMDEWHQMSLDMYRYDIELKDGALELLEFFRSKRIPMAIATANDDTLYLPCIERLGIGRYFNHIADVNSVKEGKQSAKIYEYLADKMGVKKENVLVVEDMPTCIKTAYDNGFITVAVYDKASRDYNEQKRKNSHLFVDDLSELLKALK